MRAVEYRNVQMRYGDKTIIDSLSLSIAKGAFVTIVGSSGCGKTTLLKMVNRLVTPTAGSVWVDGKDNATVNLTELRRKIGYAIQGSVLFPHMTVEKNIAYVPNLLNRYDPEKTARAVQKWLKIVGLEPDILGRYPDALSGGQQQRVGIARALAASPDLLLMDEPFGAVDEITRATLQDEIARIHRETGVTTLFVTHDMHEALRLGTHVLFMDQGRIVQYDTPENIRARPASEFVKRLIKRTES